MSDLFAMTDSTADAKLAAASANSVDSLSDVEAPWYRGALSGLGQGVVRGVANLNDLLLTGTDLIYPMSDEEREQQQFLREHALDAWTPKANEVGRAGQILGGLGEIAAPLAVGGAPLLVGSTTLAGGKRLVDEGVDAGTAGGAAALEGGAAYAGLKIPILGNTLASRLASGAVGNVAFGAGSRAAEKALLESKGYEEQAKPFTTDLASVSTDALTGLLFGGLHHTLSPRINPRLTPAQSDAVLTARNAKNFQEGTAPGAPDDIRSNVASQEAAADTLDRLSRGERADVGDIVARHEGASFTPDGRIEESARLAKMVEDHASSEFESRPRLDVPHEQIAALDVPESTKASMRTAYEKATFVKPFFDDSVHAIAREIGATDEPLVPEKVKGVDRTAEKTMADYGGDASKVKDLVRATVVVRTAEQAKAAIAAATERFGEPTKLRNTLDEKVETPDGYRDINMNFNVDGHTVELQVNFPEMIAAKEKAHALYEERRTIQAKGENTPAEQRRIDALDSEMKASYAAAWKEALSRSKASLESSTPSLRTKLSETGLPPGTSNARVMEPPPEVGSSETGTPSQSKNLGSLSKNDTADSSSGILPEGGGEAKTPSTGLESPHMQALRQLAAERPDATVYSGYDQDGQPVKSTIAAEYERIRREYEREIKDTKAYEAAVTCFLARGA